MTIYNVHIFREMKLRFDRIEAETPEAAASVAGDKPTRDADDIDDCEGLSFSALVDVAGDEEYEQSRFIDFEPERQRKACPKLLDALRWITCCPMIVGPVGTTAYIVSDERMTQARAAIAEADAAGIAARATAPKMLEALRISEGFVQWALDHGADTHATSAALTLIRTTVANAESASIRAQPPGSTLLAALQSVLPYAESEAQSLYECWKRDGDLQLKDESERCARHIERAHAAIAEAEAAGIASATTDIDSLIQTLLRRQRQVAICWSIADVKHVRPDLTDDQAWEVLEECRDQHDCEWGFTWTFIKDVADELFGDAPKTAESQGGGHEPR